MLLRSHIHKQYITQGAAITKNKQTKKTVIHGLVLAHGGLAGFLQRRKFTRNVKFISSPQLHVYPDQGKMT